MRQALANLIGQREVLLFAGVGAQVEHKLHDIIQELVVLAGANLFFAAEDSEDIAQFLENDHAAAKIAALGRGDAGFLEVIGVGEAIERRQQLVQATDGAAGVEVVVHAFEEGRPVLVHGVQEDSRSAGADKIAALLGGRRQTYRP